MSQQSDIRNWAMFAVKMREIRENFPEHSKEIDRAIFDVGQKLESCGDPNCTCRMSFENFHAISDENARSEYGFD